MRYDVERIGEGYAGISKHLRPGAPRQLWELPWASIHYPQEIQRLREDFVWDFGGPAICLIPTIL